MKKSTILTLSMIITIPLVCQNYDQQEIICPCMLEYQFPKSMEDGSNLLQTFGGVPVLRFDQAEIDGKQLICKYSVEFAKFFFEGFGVVLDGANIPHELTLTMDEGFLAGWSPSRKTVNLESYYIGDLVYTIEAPDDQCSSWQGGLYKSEYKGNQITLKRSFTAEARVNNEGTGFIIAETQTGLFTPGLSQEDVKGANLKGNQNLGKKEKPASLNVTNVESKEIPKNVKEGTTKTNKKDLKKTKKKIIK